MSRGLQKPRRKKNNSLGVALLAGVGLLAGFVAMHGRDSLISPVEVLLPIKHVRIEGEFANIDPQEVERHLLPLARGNYLTVDMKALEQAASEVAWVGSVSVTRIWPDTLQVNISEQSPVARWGSDSLLGQSGEVFVLPSQVADFSHLPVLYAPRGHEVEVLGMLDNLNKKLESRRSLVSSLKLSNRLAWTVVLSDGLEICFGSQNPLNAVDRLLGELSALGGQRLALLRKVDLRYPRGFAVTWKTPIEEGGTTSPAQEQSQKPLKSG